ncbi:MAG TPA: hypothetical protein VE173_14730, partial [Longimicrobiales bacterium]|nr:hypothetical protein [Longimicrobiales bacterium]
IGAGGSTHRGRVGRPVGGTSILFKLFPAASRCNAGSAGASGPGGVDGTPGQGQGCHLIIIRQA